MLASLMPAVGNFAGGIGKGIGDAIGGGGGGPLVSGTGPSDSRGFMDGSGWTVSTGGGRATGGTSGGTRQEGANMQPGAGGMQGLGMGTQQAGMNPVLMLALFGGAVWFIVKRLQ